MSEALKKKLSQYEAVQELHTVSLTPEIVKSMKTSDINDPVGKQYLPDILELDRLPEEYGDPIGDKTHEPVKGLVHRYPDRVLLKVSDVCAAYCRFCFRRDMIGVNGDGILGDHDIDAALDYIGRTPEIWEVILTGGDPLTLSPRRLGKIFERLNQIEHLAVVRIHTRTPIFMPERVTEELKSMLSDTEKPVYIVLHVNHSQELTDDVREAIARLSEAGCTLLSQSVLLKGVNDEVDALVDLLRNLVAIKIKPYYLHHLDYAPGTSHFRVSLEKGQALMRGLRGHISGLCMPEYVLDIPGGHGKVPITPCYLEQMGQDTYTATDYNGKQHKYMG